MASHARACTQGTKRAPVDAAGESPFSFAGMMGGISALASSSVRVDSMEVRVEAGEAADISTASTDFSLVGTLHVCVCSCMHAFMHVSINLYIYLPTFEFHELLAHYPWRQRDHIRVSHSGGNVCMSLIR